MCEGCTYICANSCNDNCGTFCNKGCLNNCVESCDELCGTECAKSCGSSCSYGCTYGCNGGCKGTCSDKCDNACKTDSAPSIIANLGINIKQGKIIKSEDFKELKTAVENELKRRNKSNLISTSSKPINIGNIVYKEHIQNIFSDIKNIDSSKTQSIDSNSIIYVEDLKEAKESIQLFMNENLNQ